MIQRSDESVEKPLRFVKMQATGNDFVVIDARQRFPYDYCEFALAATDRHTGIGADGVLYLCPSKRADFSMVYCNADGSQTTCGNGLRCIARFIYRLELLGRERREFEIESVAGVSAVHVRGSGDEVQVDMGVPVLDGALIPTRAPGKHLGTLLRTSLGEQVIYAIGMGNPHCVIFVSALEGMEIETLGREIEHHAFFPKRTNVEFVQVLDHQRIAMRVWERGVGETLSCGTGACATVVASVLAGRTGETVEVTTRGGKLEVHWERKSDKVYLSGPVEEVFHGEIMAGKLLRQYKKGKGIC